MPDTQSARVAVYLDFDNIVMSWYDRVHGRNAYSRDRQKIAENPIEPEIAERLTKATIDVGAIIDYAASFGTLVLTRAYADWSSPVNAASRTRVCAATAFGLGVASSAVECGLRMRSPASSPDQ